jgi:hypothetical protein
MRGPPSANEPDLKSELQTAPGEVQTHLDHAQQILNAFGG